MFGHSRIIFCIRPPAFEHYYYKLSAIIIFGFNALEIKMACSKDCWFYAYLMVGVSSCALAITLAVFAASSWSNNYDVYWYILFFTVEIALWELCFCHGKT